MKKISSVLLTFLIVFSGCNPPDQKDNLENDELVPDFSLEEGQESHDVDEGWVVILDGETRESDVMGGGDTGDTEDTGLEDIDWDEIDLEDLEAEAESIREEMLEEAEDIEQELEAQEEKNEDDVIWEGYLLGFAEGNPTAKHAIYMSSLTAYFYGNVYVYDDYTVGGSVTVSYLDMGECKVESPLLTCSLIGVNEGTYNVIGNVVQYRNIGQSGESWPFPNDYWLQVFFVREVAATENILVTSEFSSEDVTDSGLESILYGPFQYPHLLRSGSDSDWMFFDVKNEWATGEVSIQLYDDKEMYELFKSVYSDEGM